MWEVLPLSSSSGIVLPLKVAGAATFITRSHRLEKEEKNIAHRARPITWGDASEKLERLGLTQSARPDPTEAGFLEREEMIEFAEPGA